MHVIQMQAERSSPFTQPVSFIAIERLNGEILPISKKQVQKTGKDVYYHV
jgi:hypothetical protein